MVRTLIFITLTGISLVSCGPSSSDKTGTAETTTATSSTSVYETIDIASAKELMSKRPEMVLVDVRTPEEIAAGKIDKALEIDFSSPDFTSRIKALDKSAPYLVYCAAGGRSARAMEQMQQMGFKEVYNLADGYNGWSQAK